MLCKVRTEQIENNYTVANYSELSEFYNWVEADQAEDLYRAKVLFLNKDLSYESLLVESNYRWDNIIVRRLQGLPERFYIGRPKTKDPVLCLGVFKTAIPDWKYFDIADVCKATLVTYRAGGKRSGYLRRAFERAKESIENPSGSEFSYSSTMTNNIVRDEFGRVKKTETAMPTGKVLDMEKIGLKEILMILGYEEGKFLCPQISQTDSNFKILQDSLLGTTPNAICEALGKIPKKSGALGGILAMCLAAAVGGTKSLENIRGNIGVLNDTVFVRDGKKNCTAFALAGHYMIRCGISPDITRDWEKKYGCEHIWDFNETMKKDDNTRIKLEWCKNHPYSTTTALMIVFTVASQWEGAWYDDKLALHGGDGVSNEIKAYLEERHHALGDKYFKDA